jgi:hypothetical protein
MLLSPLVLAYISSMVDSPGHAVAGIPLLETKLYSPKWRPGLVSRPRLIERLQQGIERKLTLVSAPAGFGKTTLLALEVETLSDPSIEGVLSLAAQVYEGLTDEDVNEIEQVAFQRSDFFGEHRP